MPSFKALVIISLQILSINCSNYSSPSQSLSFTLGSNLIINSNISTPSISPAYYQDWTNNQSGWTTKVLYIEYIDPCLEQSANMLACPNFRGVTCGWQFLDTDSITSN
jgi:hypothetical protein